jgi:(1->4)-alpha-D-glucan 1-alpha-D-glucosylmutase
LHCSNERFSSDNRYERIKLYVVHRLLSYRRQYPDLFRDGAYLPLAAAGERHQHVCAFARQDEQQTLVVMVPRLLTRLIPTPQVLPLGPEVWANTWVTLPPDGVAHHYRNLFTGKSVAVSSQGGQGGVALSDIFAAFPVAVSSAIKTVGKWQGKWLER